MRFLYRALPGVGRLLDNSIVATVEEFKVNLDNCLGLVGSYQLEGCKPVAVIVPTCKVYWCKAWEKGQSDDNWPAPLYGSFHSTGLVTLSVHYGITKSHTISDVVDARYAW